MKEDIDTKLEEVKVNPFSLGKICRDEETVKRLFDISKNIAFNGVSSNGKVMKFEGTLNNVNYAVRYLDLENSKEISVSNDSWGISFIKRGESYEGIVKQGDIPEDIEEILSRLNSVKYEEKQSFKAYRRYSPFAEKRLKFS